MSCHISIEYIIIVNDKNKLIFEFTLFYFFFKNFDPTNSKNNKHSHSSHLGGSVVLAYYCPFMQQVSWSINDEVRDSKCTFEENKPDKNKNYIMEEYGENSKCFLHNRTWQIYTDQCRSRITVSKTIGCYNVLYHVYKLISYDL